MIEDVAYNPYTHTLVEHYIGTDGFGYVLTCNDDGTIRSHVYYENPLHSADRFNLEANRAHPAGGA